MSAPVPIEQRQREAALAALEAANKLATAMTEAHAGGVNFEVSIQFNSGAWVVTLTPFTRTPIRLSN